MSDGGDDRRPHPVSEVTAAGEGRAGWRAAVGAELLKLRGTRSLVWTLVATGLVLPVLAVVVALTGSLQPDDTILGAGLTGAVLAQLLAAVVGALTVTGEHAHGTLRTTFLAQPRRAVVVAAKAVVVAGTVAVVGLAGSGAAFLLGLATLDRAAHPTGDPWPALLGIALTLAVTALLGLAVGAVVRRSAGAVAAVVGVLLAPSLLAPLAGDLQRWVAGASPAAALEKLTQTSDATAETVGALGGWPSLLVVVLWTAGLLATATRLVERRDA
ncbi:MAG TPA: ABC transporter permease subunit [Acidimicrobiales bacterium]